MKGTSMDAFPLNLIFAVFTASATIFLGFLPTKNVKSTFFTEQTILACFAWALVAVTVPHKVAHYPAMVAFLCFASWWNFRKDRALAGKMWLSVASGLGISVGVMLILAVTPQAVPPDLPDFYKTLLLSSIYLGGTIIGLAYVCFTLVQNSKSGVTQGLIQRYVGLLLSLTLIHAIAVALSAWFSAITVKSRYALSSQYPEYPPDSFFLTYNYPLFYLLAGLTLLVLPVLAYRAYQGVQFSSRIQPTRILVAFILLGILSEILARLFVF